ncbi:MAG TPA: carbohydrate ABC transporter permease [bacterium]|jgi:multiple sugar transport system permease protein|nr:carbohydrate ABC transporter permease [bacterium]
MTDTNMKKANGFWASKKRSERITKIVVTILLFIGAVAMMLPVVWMLSTSFKTRTDVFAVPPIWVPDPLHLENYPNAWNIVDPQTGRAMFAGDSWEFFGITIQGVNFTTYVINTLFISISACVGTTLSAAFVAFAFARLRFPGRGPLWALCLATMMVPAQVTMIPQFVLFKTMGWYDTFWPLIVPAWLGGGAYYIFLMRQFFMTIPYEMDEAAKIDGCTNFGVFWRILLPLCKPALTTVAVFSFVANWNDFLNPLIYLDSNSKKTLALGLTNFVSLYGQDYHLLMAASLIISVPIAVMFLVGQRYFIQGIATTGLK